MSVWSFNQSQRNLQELLMNRLDSEEKGILKAFNAGEFKQIQGIYQELSRHKVIAEATFKKDARINIRLSFP